MRDREKQREQGQEALQRNLQESRIAQQEMCRLPTLAMIGSLLTRHRGCVGHVVPVLSGK
jgi:hypothetical protein